jgi:hypothetical protein
MHKQIQLHQHLPLAHLLPDGRPQAPHLSTGTGIEQAGRFGIDQHPQTQGPANVGAGHRPAGGAALHRSGERR